MYFLNIIVFKSFVRGKYVNRKHELLSIITMAFFMKKLLPWQW